MTYPHIVPVLGRVKLKTLNPVHVRNVYREKLDSGLSSATVRKIHGVLQKALDQAVSDGLIPRNAAKGIRLPQGKKKEIRPLSPDEARTLGLCLRRPSRGAFRAGGFHRPARGRASGPQVGGPGSGCASAIAP
jgi:hypothetical protein